VNCPETADILLTTEGTYPYVVGGVSEWAHRLIEGLPDHRFTVYAVVANPYIVRRYPPLANVETVLAVPLWGTEHHAEYRCLVSRSGRKPGGLLNKTWRRMFLPAYAALLDALLESGAAKAPEAAETALMTLADYADIADLKWALQQPATWRLFQERMARHPLFRHLSILDAITLGRMVYRYLAPLAYPAPVPRLGHASAAAFSALPLIVLKHRHGVPFILTEHGVYYRERLLALGREDGSTPYRFFLAAFYSVVVRLIYRTADRIAPVAQFNQRWETALGVEPERIRPIPNGVDPQRFQVTRLAGSGSAPLTVVQVARLDPLKDIHTALRAMAVLRTWESQEPALQGIRLVIWGPPSEPTYAQSCQQLHHSLKLGDRVTFAGATTNPAAAFEAGDIALLSSISEGFPFTAVEALMAERPLVATAVGGMAEIVRPPYGRLVAPRRPQELAEAIRTFARQRSQLAAWGRLGREAMLRQYTLSHFLAAYRQLYAEVASRSRG